MFELKFGRIKVQEPDENRILMSPFIFVMRNIQLHTTKLQPVCYLSFLFRYDMCAMEFN